ncbi:MAG: SRPBCC family protein [Flavobacteriaceae bacterium]|nr:SRPBCC family protein [Flavobacteriaceae bacterium]
MAVLGLIAPKSYDVSRSIDIDRPRSEVFNYVRSLQKQDEWSPWGKRDPNMKKQFEGTDCQVGAISKWQGNKEVGEGEQEITRIVDNERIESRLRFFKPWKSESDAYMKLSDNDSRGTNFTWGFSGKNKFPMSIMMLFMNMDKAVGKDFEEGLASLKEILEN